MKRDDEEGQLEIATCGRAPPGKKFIQALRSLTLFSPDSLGRTFASGLRASDARENVALTSASSSKVVESVNLHAADGLRLISVCVERRLEDPGRPGQARQARPSAGALKYARANGCQRKLKLASEKRKR